MADPTGAIHSGTVHSGTVHSGADALVGIVEAVGATGAERVLLVTGRSSFDSSGASSILEPLRRVADVRRWSDFRPNTDAADLSAGLRLAADYGADAVVGIGGGSVMDMAKLLCAFDGIVDEAALHKAIRSGDAIVERGMGLALAPTTSGSGSEATHFAVVYIGSDKFSIAGPALRADHVGLDPELARSGSPHQRATSGMDAICQAIESRWAAGGTRRSRRYAEFALTELLRSIEPFVATGDLESSRGMQFGSHLAGRAIDISKTTAAHALSYGITKQYGVDHGSAASLTLGQFIRRHADLDATGLQAQIDPTDHQRAMEFILRALGAQDGTEAQRHFTSLLDRIGLPSALTDVGSATPAELDELAVSVNAQRLGNNPAVFDTAGLREVLEDSR